MVTVEVRQDEQVDVLDAEQGEARPESLRVVAGVDQCRLPVAPEQGRVALADVAHRGGPARRHRTADEHVGHGDRTDTEDDRHRRSDTGQPSDPPWTEHRDHQRGADHGREEDPDRGSRPRGRGRRQCRGAVRDLPDAGGGDPPDRREELRSGRPQRGEEARHEPHDGRDRCEHLGEQVGRHGVGR